MISSFKASRWGCISLPALLVYLMAYSHTFDLYKAVFDSFDHYSRIQHSNRSSRHTAIPIWTNKASTSPVVVIRGKPTMNSTAGTKRKPPQGDDDPNNSTSITDEPQLSPVSALTEQPPRSPHLQVVPKATLGATNSTNRAKMGTNGQTLTRGRRRITMIVALSGELGNNLLRLIPAYALKLHIEDQIPDVTIELVGEHQDNSKWTKPANDIQQCFINLRKFDFSSGRWVPKSDPFVATQKAQSDWLQQKFKGNHSPYLLKVNNQHGPDRVIDTLRVLLQQQHDEPSNGPIHQEPPPNNENTKSIVSLPYLRIDKMGGLESLVEKYRSQIQQWLVIDTSNPMCCGVLPDPDEGVFHFRNFAGEGFGRLPSLGFVEVGPKHVQRLLEENLMTSKHNITQVAFITRHYHNNPKAAEEHVHAIQQSDKLNLRVIQNQTGIQDFCLLMHSKHIVATRLSSYADVAGILGNQTSVLTYMVNTKETSQRKAGLLKPKSWKESNGVLANRFQHRNYPNEWRY